MNNQFKSLRAIDLYSGIGGWSLGLKMAGIEVVASYEWWGVANKTNQENNRHPTTEIDIRSLPLSSLPSKIDIVVGSPPCTQFSMANRGGSGDIADGLKDVEKFLQIVDHLRPKFWAMENVPRLAGIFERESGIGGVLYKYSHLAPRIHVIDTQEWGLPQRRQRCIIGSFPFDLLHSYRQALPKRTLGNVVYALSGRTIKDPIYGGKSAKQNLYDHVAEDFLSPEEARMNRDMKQFHPIYNNMVFPDPMERPARTVTATCTRVSRESIVIEEPNQPGHFRRLTVRERGCLQGFPVAYQFFGRTYTQKIKMIGNAVPPLFTFYIGQAMRGVVPEKLLSPSQGVELFKTPAVMPPRTMPDSVGHSYPANRRFRSAIPNLRFKSGVRFELANAQVDATPTWRVSFYYGNAKRISEVVLDEALLVRILRAREFDALQGAIESSLYAMKQTAASTDGHRLQQTWSHKAKGGVQPYDVVDVMGVAAGEMISVMQTHEQAAHSLVSDILEEAGRPPGADKVLKNAVAVTAGFIVGASFNSVFTQGFIDRQTLEAAS